MSRGALSILLLLAATGFAAAQEAPTYEGLVQKHARERAEVARIKSRTVALQELEKLLDRQEGDLRTYASDRAPIASAALARALADEHRLERLRLRLDGHSEQSIEPTADERSYALLVEHAAGESQEELVRVLDARAKAMKVALRGPGAVTLSGADARRLGVRWGAVELLVDGEGTIRGVDLVGDERQNLLAALTKGAGK